MKFLSLILLFTLAITSTSPGGDYPAQEPIKNNPIMQKRYCMALDLRNDPALIREYKKLHSKDGIWPEIPRGIKEAGINDMEIYLWGTRMFMILDVPVSWDYDSRMAWLGTLDRQAEWADYMWKFQQLLPFDKNKERWMFMDNVFQLNPTGLKEKANTGYGQPGYSQPTKRICRTLDLKDNPELISKYRYYHSPEAHWEVISEGIRKVGIIDMQIYLVGNRMFMIVEAPPDFQWDEQMKKLSVMERQNEWETLMHNYQQALPGTGVINWEEMEKVFDLDRDF